LNNIFFNGRVLILSGPDVFAVNHTIDHH